ncbi:MAG: SAM-dependent methyltransferase [Treponema sp.]|nr:SAM-dependent methyltransferase [Treponema sp.]
MLTFNFHIYTLEQYTNDIKQYDLETVWSAILDYMLVNNTDEATSVSNRLLKIENFGMLYEYGLAEQNKTNKKNLGQYFTPDDIACLMARWLKSIKGDNVCDVCCGTGNLILAYLKQIEKNEIEHILSGRKIYLYDNDKIALKIARYSIALVYGKKYLNSINTICGDFLDKDIKLPDNAKVISNPPYAKITQIQSNWHITENIITSKDLYSAIFEKIANSGSRAVIITPYSFLGSSKFYPLRKVLNNYNGFIAAFDNVPGNIFNGKKHGIFNSNTANSVRASITVIKNQNDSKGFKISHLIRFKTEEREKLLNNTLLENLISSNMQIVSRQQPCYIKCHRELENAYTLWTSQSNKKLSDLLNPFARETSLHDARETSLLYANNLALYIPNTCRYFTTASVSKLNRTGMITLYAKDKKSFDFLYCLINSSFAYWHWRIFDGGITYPIRLLNELPIFENLLSNDDSEYFSLMCKKMTSAERQYIVTKLNAGAEQENIKFPAEFREQINARFFKILGCTDNPELLRMVHSNAAF